MDEDQVAELYDATVEKIYRFFYYKVLNREVAEDLTSQVFTTFIKKIKESNTITNPKAFLYGVAKNIFLVHLKQAYRLPAQSIEAEEFEDIVDTSLSEDEKPTSIIDMLEALLPQFPDKQRYVLKLRFVDKLSISEIAEKLGKDQNYVSTTQKRAFQTLREILKCTDPVTNIVEKEKKL